ncbi:MAG: hypothetical protein IT285_14955 [Bdellovibrionales bacterium]|nr:hypothetical protein [Bdellovibrionales bacterium]
MFREYELPIKKVEDFTFSESNARRSKIHVSICGKSGPEGVVILVAAWTKPLNQSNTVYSFLGELDRALVKSGALRSVTYEDFVCKDFEGAEHRPTCKGLKPE